ncbi:MAG: tyrosine-protein phosphatase [Deltaproteobacteria bacterium]|nr:tyrosine-protein phosphatase [Deltaproteobacteria bacterium]MBN2671548.1 tyrosine-protein phosphatase [Deltaproteobacteria bacterium]
MNRSVTAIKPTLMTAGQPFLYSAVCIFALSVLAYGCRAPAVPPQDRPAEWAAPKTVAGVKNFHQLNDHLFRGAQPTESGFHALKRMGVKTIVNLRNFHSDKDGIAEAELNGVFHVVEIPMDAWNVTEAEIVTFLKVAADPTKQPLFFHCKHGSDRTGTMAAAYRIVVENWSKKDALAEMTQGGFGFHPIWRNLPHLIEDLDVASIRAQLNR